MVRKRKKRRPSFVFVLLLILLSLFVGGMAGVLAAVYKNMPRLEYFEYNPSLTTKIYDVHGELIADLYYIENRVHVPISQMPMNLRNAVVAIEDERFYSHHGIDFRALMRALVVDLKLGGAAAQGGSTITQQLAKNAFLTFDKTLTRKIQEALLSIQLERKYTKDEILELYLNEVYFGHAAYGVAAAAETFFGKQVQDLNLEECALLAAVLKGPGFYSPYFDMEAALQRRNLVLTVMAQQGYITEAEAEAAKAKPIRVLDKPKIRTRNASYFLDQVVSYLLDRYGSTITYRGGLKVYTTLDLNLQRLAEEALLSALPDWYTNNEGIMQPQGAMLVMEPQTGYIRAMVGGRGTDKYNRAVQAMRQPGSLLKPFVYLTAFQEGYTLASIIDDSPVEYRNSDGSIYAPSNYNNRFQGPITLRSALQGSVNVATIKLLEEVGLAKVWNVLHSMGITSLSRKDDYNLALALGGVSKGVTLMEMCAAYSIFANRGIKVEPIIVEKVVDKDGIVLEHNKPKRSVLNNFSEETMFLIHSALEGVVKSPSGTGRRANIDGLAIAGKTGTTNNNTNAWFIGYTPTLLAGVYLGNDAQSQPMSHNGTSISSGTAAEIWASFMKKAVPINESNSSFAPPPPGITTTSIIAQTGLLAGPSSNGTRIDEYFVKGTEPNETSVSYRQLTARVCKTSNELATDACPSTVMRTYYDVLVELPDGSYRPILLPRDFPTEYCTVHGVAQQ